MKTSIGFNLHFVEGWSSLFTDVINIPKKGSLLCWNALLLEQDYNTKIARNKPINLLVFINVKELLVRTF